MRNLVGAPIAPELAAEALRVAEAIRQGRLRPQDAEQVIDVNGAKSATSSTRRYSMRGR